MKTQEETKTKKKTHIQTVIEAYALNLHFLEKELGLPTTDYNATLFDTCMRFLEEVCPPGYEYHAYYLRYAKCKRYWSWFKAEWMLFETDFMFHSRESNIPITIEDWTQHMKQMIMDGSVEHSFYNIYLKSIRNEKS